MLFAERGVDEVTTRQIADEAGIGTGTSFPSARTKGEFLMLVQNSLHTEALAHGRADAENAPDALGAVMAIAQRGVTRTGPMSATGASTCARWPSVTPLIPVISRPWPSPRAPRKPSPPSAAPAAQRERWRDAGARRVRRTLPREGRDRERRSATGRRSYCRADAGGAPAGSATADPAPGPLAIAAPRSFRQFHGGDKAMSEFRGHSTRDVRSSRTS
ncbi:helix-turn-helix domain-containing protein [Streptomyces sp. NPDC006477]|uniref:helix-turn-helix domain-containing protein n=1 Tax=Streptomyces sp. NPDC006477 TaxID=3364747 RepID=UPI00369E0064